MNLLRHLVPTAAVAVCSLVGCAPNYDQWAMNNGGSGGGGSVSELAALPQLPIVSDIVPVPAGMAKLVIAVRANIPGPIAPGDTLETAQRACMQLSKKMLPEIGLPNVVDETAPHDLVFEFSCTSGVEFKSGGGMVAIFPPGAGKPSIIIYDAQGAVFDSFVHSHQPMRCPSSNADEQTQIMQCGKAYGMMVDAEIAGWLGNNPKLVQLAAAK